MFFCHLCTAEEADSTVWYTLMAYFPSSCSSYCFSGKKKKTQKNKPADFQISPFPPAQHISVGMWSERCLALFSTSALICALFHHGARTRAGQARSAVLNGGWWKQLNGQNARSWWAVSRSLWRQVHFTVLRVPWSDSLRRNVIRNSTMMQDRPVDAGGRMGGTFCDVRVNRRDKRSP